MKSGNLFWLLGTGVGGCILLLLTIQDPQNSSAYLVASALLLLVFVSNLRSWRQQKTAAKIDSIIMVSDVETLKRAYNSEAAVLYKHSYACPISRAAMNQIQQFAQKRPSIPVFLIDVLGQRKLSDAISKDLEIAHESPQAIVVRASKRVWDASHYAITAEALSDKIPAT